MWTLHEAVRVLRGDAAQGSRLLTNGRKELHGAKQQTIDTKNLEFNETARQKTEKELHTRFRNNVCNKQTAIIVSGHACKRAAVRHSDSRCTSMENRRNSGKLQRL